MSFNIILRALYRRDLQLGMGRLDDFQERANFTIFNGLRAQQLLCFYPRRPDPYW